MKRNIYLCGFLLMIPFLSNISFAADSFFNVDKIDGFKLEIGEVVPQSFIDNNKPSELIKIGSEQSLPGYSIKSKKITYKICCNESKVITFIYSDDESFVSPEKIKPGMLFMDALKIRNKTPNSVVTMEKGWVSFIPFQSGWNAAVLLDQNNQWSIFDQVAFLFKRKQ